MKNFNLSEWALKHQSFVLYCIVVLGYHRKTQKGFMGHLSYRYPGNLEVDLKAVIGKINETALEDLEITLVTRQFSRFGQTIYDHILAMGIEPKVSGVQGVFQTMDYRPEKGIQYSEQFVHPGLVFVFKDDLPAAGVFFLIRSLPR